MKQKLEITGVLLTGGESRRMGQNKALLEINGKSLIQKNLDVLKNICSEVIISSRDEKLYHGYGYPVIPDVLKGKGPLGGLYSVLQKANYEKVFLVGCDMPFINEEAIRWLFQELEDFDTVVPYIDGKMHPLHAFYHRRIMPVIEEKLYNDKLRLADVLDECQTKVVDCDKILDLTLKKELEKSVMNINTPEEWQKALINIQNM